eukprot:166685-Rhodomonas_salina.1
MHGLAPLFLTPFFPALCGTVVVLRYCATRTKRGTDAGKGCAHTQACSCRRWTTRPSLPWPSRSRSSRSLASPGPPAGLCGTTRVPRP